LQSALCDHVGIIPLTPDFHDKLDDWHHILAAISSRPTHMLEVISIDAMLKITHDTSSNGTGAIFCKLDGTPQV